MIQPSSVSEEKLTPLSRGVSFCRQLFGSRTARSVAVLSVLIVAGSFMLYKQTLGRRVSNHTPVASQPTSAQALSSADIPAHNSAPTVASPTPSPAQPSASSAVVAPSSTPVPVAAATVCDPVRQQQILQNYTAVQNQENGKFHKLLLPPSAKQADDHDAKLSELKWDRDMQLTQLHCPLPS